MIGGENGRIFGSSLSKKFHPWLHLMLTSIDRNQGQISSIIHQSHPSGSHVGCTAQQLKSAAQPTRRGPQLPSQLEWQPLPAVGQPRRRLIHVSMSPRNNSHHYLQCRDASQMQP